MPLINPTISYTVKHQRIGANRYVVPGWITGNTGAFGLGNGNLFYIPVYVGERATFDRIGTRVVAAGGAGSLARLGIYRENGTLPGALVVDAGTVATDALAFVEAVINVTLGRGHYFLAIVGDDAGVNLEALGNSNPGCLAGWEGFNVGQAQPAYLCTYIGGHAADVAGGLADPAAAPGFQSASVAGTMVYLRE